MNLPQPALVISMIHRFIRQEMEKTNLQHLVLGLSGGVDSALALGLCAQAIGKDRVTAVFMPSSQTAPLSRTHALAVASAFDVELQIEDIAPLVEGYFSKDDVSAKRRGNFMARTRMAILFDLSAKYDALVLGTSNKTELLLGYGTWYGDLASSLNPIGDLYKSQVWALAEYVGVPKDVISKAPSADLWLGQTDEEELGFSYAEADAILFALVDERRPIEEVSAMGHKPDVVSKVVQYVTRSQFKRRLPIICKLTPRTVGIDFRYPRDWGT